MNGIFKRILRWILSYAMLFVNDKRAMVFDLMRIIFMLISIIVGNFAGAMIGGYIGVAGGLIGAFIVGIVIYSLYSLLSGQPTNLMGAMIFGVLNYVSILITGYVGTMVGFTGGIVVTLIQACILSMLWGWFGGQAQTGVKSGIQPKPPTKGKSKGK